MGGGKGESKGTEKGKEEKRGKDQGQWKVESGEGERGKGRGKASKDRTQGLCRQRREKTEMPDEKRRAALHISRVTESESRQTRRGAVK